VLFVNHSWPLSNYTSKAIDEFYKYNVTNGTEIEEGVFNISDIDNFNITFSNTEGNQTNFTNHTRRAFELANITSLISNLKDLDHAALLSQMIAEISAQGGFIGIYSVRSLKYEKDWSGTIIAIALGSIMVMTGLAILGPGFFLGAGAAAGAGAAGGATAGAAAVAGAGTLGTFSTSFAMGLVASGIGDIISGISSAVKGVPIDLESHLKKVAVGIAVKLVTAGALHALSSIDSLRLITANKKFLQGLKDAGTTGFLSQQVIFQAAMYGINEFTQKQAEDYTDRNKEV
jgi:hypothetical protein